MKTLLVILLALPLLVSFAPVPPPIYRTHIAMLSMPDRVPAAQGCTWATAPARLEQQIEDTIGYPYGLVRAFSCEGDSQAVIAELAQRVATMHAAAAAYRAAHPITGVTK